MSIARDMFLKKQPMPPWECFFCGKPIVSRTRKLDGLAVHHKDGDQHNNTWDNFAPAHSSCHSRYHRKDEGMTVRPEFKSPRCPRGCTCDRHKIALRNKPCPPGCKCNKHFKPRCPIGCKCGKHKRRRSK